MREVRRAVKISKWARILNIGLKQSIPGLVCGLVLFSAQPAASADFDCHKTTPQPGRFFVEDVRDDGTIVIGPKGGLVLAGVVIPEALDEKGRESLCRSQTLQYLRATLKGKNISAYPVDIATKDEKGRVTAYIVLENGEFLNKQLVRLGLARAQEKNPLGLYLDCKDLMASTEEFAKKRKLGIWGSSCK